MGRNHALPLWHTAHGGGGCTLREGGDCPYPSFGAVTQILPSCRETTDGLKAKCQCLLRHFPGLLISPRRNPSISFLRCTHLVPAFWGHGGRGAHRFRMPLHSKRQTTLCLIECLRRLNDFLSVQGYREEAWQLALSMYLHQCPPSAFPRTPTFPGPGVSVLVLQP